MLRINISSLSWDESEVQIDTQKYPLNSISWIHAGRTMPFIDGRTAPPTPPRHYELLQGQYQKTLCEIDVPEHEIEIWMNFQSAVESAKKLDK